MIRTTRIIPVCALLASMLLVACPDPNILEPAPDDDTPIDPFDGNFDPGDGFLIVNPDPILFEVDTLGESASQVITLENNGPYNLVIFDLESIGDRADEVQVVNADLPIGLRPGEVETIELSYTATECGGSEKGLRFTWTGANTPYFELAVETVGLDPFLVLDRERLSFGRVPAGALATELVTLSNDGGCPEYLDAIDLDASDNFTFQVLNAFGQRLTWNGVDPVEVPPHSAVWIEVRLLSTDEPESGFLHIHSVSEDRLDSVALYANGREPPVAVATGEIEDRPEESGTDFATIPLTTLLLDGSQSFDPDQEVVEYIWSVEQRPDDSTSALEFGEDPARPEFFVDLAGDYTFQLIVVDDDDLESVPALVRVSSVPAEDLHIQLVWHTPGDPNELDNNGTDVDLHLLRTPGDWNDSLDDCHWSSQEPDWGVLGDRSDNPSLDIDDTSGAGPENINLDNPNIDHVYGVGVYYYSDDGYGFSDATVRIYIDGLQIFEETRRLEQRGDFWYVGDVTWIERIGRDFDFRDEMHSGFPN